MRPIIVLSTAALTAALITACSFFQAAPSECIQAAESADLPNSVIEQIRDPDALDPIQQAALQKILRRAGIDDACDFATNNRDRSSSTSPNVVTPPPQQDQPSIISNIIDPTNQPNPSTTERHHECLDEIFLRGATTFGGEHATAAAVLYCTDLQPQYETVSNTFRCKTNSIGYTAAKYPEWFEILHHGVAAAKCYNIPYPEPSAKTTPTGSPSPYAHCLDTVYLEHGYDTIAAWLCRSIAPEPPATHLQRCHIRSLDATREAFPEWSSDLHDWHAVMLCLPGWTSSTQTDWDTYDTCLADVYLQVNELHEKDTAIPAAVWRCRAHKPEPPTTYSPRCILDAARRDDGESTLPIPAELYLWRAIIKCIPPSSL